MAKIRSLGLALGLAAWMGPNAQSATEIFPLEAVRAGQEGVWRTVVEGSEIREFPLRILGVMEDFIGPGQPAIIAEAVDPENVLSGPVAGMSGSPVYLDGKLLGAYAYGYVWPKEQAIIGITPIESMLALRDYPDEPPSAYEGWPGIDGRSTAARPQSAEKNVVPTLSGSASEALLKPLPTPLGLAGFGARTIESFRHEWDALGLSPVSGASSSGAGQGASAPVGPLDLRPGGAVAGVLMTGDFSAAATGTITFVEGNELLAFGHPFLQEGSVAMPLASAEVLTIVRHMRSSFKLSRVGAIQGILRQDRKVGVAGELGPLPPMIPFSLEVERESGPVQQYAAEIWPHVQYFPLLAAMALQEALLDVDGKESRETVVLDGTLTLANGETFPLRDMNSGAGSATNVALDLLERLRNLAENPFSPVEVSSISLKATASPGVRETFLREVRVGSTRVRAGDRLPLQLELLDYYGEKRLLKVEVTLPPEARAGTELQILVGDGGAVSRTLNLERRRTTADSLEDWLAPFREAPALDAIHVLVLEARDGPEIGGEALPRPPSSVGRSLASPATAFRSAEAPPYVYSFESYPVGQIFSGSHLFSVTLQ